MNVCAGNKPIFVGMSIEDIQKFVDKKTTSGNEYVKIYFKKREPIFGRFVKCHGDYNELKAKNFWRIVPQKSVEEYNKSKNIDLSRLFFGEQFAKLATYDESFG
jgi:hypothetical protein